MLADLAEPCFEACLIAYVSYCGFRELAFHSWDSISEKHGFTSLVSKSSVIQGPAENHIQ
jgi:hypothetical protein